MGPQNQSIDQLSAQVEKNALKTPLPGKRNRQSKRWLTILALIVTIGIWGYHLSGQLSTNDIYGDLKTLIEQSRNNVDSYINNQQKLPERINNPGLAVLVTYQPQPEAAGRKDFPYRLTAQAGRFIMTWDSRQPAQFIRKGE